MQFKHLAQSENLFQCLQSKLFSVVLERWVILIFWIACPIAFALMSSKHIDGAQKSFSRCSFPSGNKNVLNVKKRLLDKWTDFPLSECVWGNTQFSTFQSQFEKDQHSVFWSVNQSPCYIISATDFPKPIARHASLYYADTFLIMGGDQCNGCNACTCTNCPTHDTIHQWELKM